MKSEGVFEHIESLAFSTHVNIASDFRSFVDVLDDQECVRVLLANINSTDDYLEVLHHVIELCDATIDERYRHPMDSALAAFLYVLRQKHFKIALVAAENVKHVPNLWWASMMAEEVIANSRVEKDMAEEGSLITDRTPSTNYLTRHIIKTDSPTVRISRRDEAGNSWDNLNSQNVHSQENRVVLP